MIGQSGRHAQDVADQPQQRRIGVKHREDLDAGRQAAEKAIEGEKGRVRIGLLGQRLQEVRHQLGRAVRAPACCASPDSGRGASRAPPRRPPGRFRSPAAPASARVSGSASAPVNTRLPPTTSGDGQSGRVLEQLGVVALDPAQGRQQFGRKGIEFGVAEEDGERAQLRRIVGQRVGLLVVDHLQPVLDPAQEPVGSSDVGRDLGADLAGAGQRRQRRNGAVRPHRRDAPAPDQLLRLDEELDLADAAAAELDVVAAQRDAAAAAMRVDLPLDRMDVLDGGEVEVLAPDEGDQPAQEGLARVAIARHRTRLDHGGALPVLAKRLVVLLGRHRRDGDRRRTGVGAQPQIGAEDVAVDGAFGHQPDQAAGQASRLRAAWSRR